MNAIDIQAQGDRELAESLLAIHEIQQVIERFKKQSKDYSARRHLLSSSMRLSPQMAPDVHRTMQACSSRLGLNAPIETFVYPGPFFNAAAVRPERGRLFIILSSSLLEAFDSDELNFVIGHELGHHLYDHHRIPVGALLEGSVHISPGLVLQLFAWQRYAEISADRTGLLCTGSLSTAARALFKMASGLRGGRVTIDIEQFLAQAHDLRDEIERDARVDEPMRRDWFATHPFSPLRLVAAELFTDSEFMRESGISSRALEEKIHDLMGVMSPSYLSENSTTAETMRRLLFAAAVAVANANGTLSQQEIKALEELLGPGRVPTHLDPEAINDVLPSRIEDVKNNVPPLRRAQIIRDLCIIAQANGEIDDAELQVINSVAEGIDVDATSMACTIKQQTMNVD